MLSLVLNQLSLTAPAKRVMSVHAKHVADMECNQQKVGIVIDTLISCVEHGQAAEASIVMHRASARQCRATGGISTLHRSDINLYHATFHIHHQVGRASATNGLEKAAAQLILAEACWQRGSSASQLRDVTAVSRAER